MRVYNYTGILATVDFLRNATESERLDVAQKLASVDPALAVDFATALFAAVDVAEIPEAPDDSKRRQRIWDKVLRGIYADDALMAGATVGVHDYAVLLDL